MVRALEAAKEPKAPSNDGPKDYSMIPEFHVGIHIYIYTHKRDNSHVYIYIYVCLCVCMCIYTCGDNMLYSKHHFTYRIQLTYVFTHIYI